MCRWRSNTSPICGDRTRTPFRTLCKMGLRNARSAGEATFGQFAALYALLHMLDESMLQEFKIHKPQYETDFPLK